MKNNKNQKNKRFDWIAPQTAREEMGLPKSQFDTVLEYAKKRVEVQSFDPILPIYVRNEIRESNPNQKYPYLFLRNDLEDIKLDMAIMLKNKVVMIEDRDKWVTAKQALILMEMAKSEKEALILYAEDRFQRQLKEPGIGIYVLNQIKDVRQKEPYLFSVDHLKEIRKDMIEEGFYVPVKTQYDLNAREVVDCLNVAPTIPNKRKVNNLMQDMYDKKSLIVYERRNVRHKTMVVCTQEENLVYIQEALIENKIDLTPKKNKKDTALKLAV